MGETLVETLNAQLLRVDKAIGSQALSHDFLVALDQTFESYTGDRSSPAVLGALLELYRALLDCKPRMPNLILSLQQLILMLHEDPKIEITDFHQAIERLMQQREDELTRIVESAAKLIGNENKTVLLHSYSRKINSVLSKLAAMDVKFNVIVAIQEPEKSDRLIQSLASAGLEYAVVSEYAIAHVMPEIDLALFGALTIDASGRIIMGPGSSSLISNLNNSKIPCYILMNSSKFNLWEGNTPPAYKEIRQKRAGHVEYKKQVFSHDLLDTQYITGFITERGILSPSEVIEYLRSLQTDFLKREQTVESLLEQQSAANAPA